MKHEKINKSDKAQPIENVDKDNSIVPFQAIITYDIYK